MQRRTLFAMIAATALVACAPLQSTNPIAREVRQSLTFSSITVNTTGAAFDSGRATEFSSSLKGDLETALKTEFVDRLDPAGVQMVVDLARINLAGSTTTAFGRDQSTMSGSVRILDGDALLGTYAIQVVAGDAAQTRTGALFDSAIRSSNGYYRSLVNGFARDARVQVLGADLPGERALRQLQN